MEIGNFKKSDNPVYRDFFATNDFVIRHLENVFYAWSPRSQRGFSVNSFCFGDWHTALQSTSDRIAWTYGVLNRVFDLGPGHEKHFMESVKGGGNEWRRINQLNSSSLLAFLCFANVEYAPLVCCLPSVGNVEFDRVHFEVRNRVPGGGGISNMDVVLSGSNHDVVLFIESKFSEYLDVSHFSSPIAAVPAYSKIFSELSIGGLRKGHEYLDKKGRSVFRLEADKKNYLDGIKQFVAHWLAIRDAANKNSLYTGKKLFLAELAFDFGETSPLRDYEELHHSVANSLSMRGGRVFVVSEVLKYQRLFSGYELRKSIRDFYKF